LTGGAFSTIHLADNDKTEHNYKQEQQNHTRKLLAYAQTKPTETTVKPGLGDFTVLVFIVVAG